MSLFRRFLIPSLFLLSFCFLVRQTFAVAVSPKQEFLKAKVTNIVKEGVKQIVGQKNIYQDLQVTILEGVEKGKTVAIENGGDFSIANDQKVAAGETIILEKTTDGSGAIHYAVYDKFRLYPVIVLLFAFCLLIVFIAGKKGIGSLLGLLISLCVIFFFIVPHMIAGEDPLLISSIGSIVILLLTSFLAHGFSRKTSLAVVSTLTALLITVFLAWFFVSLAKLSGLGSEEAYTLQLGPTSVINLKGLLLGGIIIGTLGALNDITTTQAAAIFEMGALEKKLKFEELYDKGFAVGREHVVSLVNTLILAYAGSAFAIFIFFSLNPNHQPYWVILNSETVSEEIIRTIAGSIGLVLSVPIVTILTSWFVTRYEKK